MAITEAIKRLGQHIKTVPVEFQQFSPDVLLQKPAPGKWSKQEILGHLIDSAINNLKRFTDSQYLPQPYAVIRYQQDDLVALNHYQQLPLSHLLDLWKKLNEQIVYVVNHIPAENLAHIIIIPSGESKTLEWLIIDYVEHMEHHLKQVSGKAV